MASVFSHFCSKHSNTCILNLPEPNLELPTPSCCQHLYRWYGHRLTDPRVRSDGFSSMKAVSRNHTCLTGNGTQWYRNVSLSHFCASLALGQLLTYYISKGKVPFWWSKFGPWSILQPQIFKKSYFGPSSLAHCPKEDICVTYKWV